MFWEFVREYGEHSLALYAAALSFYTIFSVGPLFFLFVFVGTWWFPGFERAAEDVLRVVFEESAAGMIRFVEGYSFDPSGVVPAVLSIVFIVFVATRLLSVLQDAMNRIWGFEGERGVLMKRLVALVLIVVMGVIVASGLAVHLWLQRVAAGTWFVVLSSVVGFLLVWALLMALYMTIPLMTVHWVEAMTAAFVTSVFFVIGSSIIDVVVFPTGQYAVGNFVITLLIWVYYNWQSVLVGSQLAKVWLASDAGGP